MRFVLAVMVAGATAVATRGSSVVEDLDLAVTEKDVEEGMLMLEVQPAFLRGGKTHYGNPAEGCEDDEVAVRVQGVAGAICSPLCTKVECPSDVPQGTGEDVKPQCILQDARTGNKYCALACHRDGKCPPDAACQTVFGNIGICTY